MSKSVNKATIIGNLGQDPKIMTFDDGSRVANLSVATAESWKNAEGEVSERTDWHNVSIRDNGDGLVSVVDKYLKKGHKVYIEGKLETRSWLEDDGKPSYMTEIVLRPYHGELVLLTPQPKRPEADRRKTTSQTPRNERR